MKWTFLATSTVSREKINIIFKWSLIHPKTTNFNDKQLDTPMDTPIAVGGLSASLVYDKEQVWYGDVLRFCSAITQKDCWLVVKSHPKKINQATFPKE